ncbi:helix-turn-helix domain-containing protein [Rhodococcus koreensis]|uniref:helix-turn-helix domain-containing protein n=1 Tax=Rhodococcus koreensis TaxID=99653 RepID=UPI003084589C
MSIAFDQCGSGQGDRIPAPRAESFASSRAHRTASCAARHHRFVGCGSVPEFAIARALLVSVETVRKWRGRWNAAPGVASLGDAKRSGRPPKFTPVQVTRVKAMACTPPKECGVPLARWSCPELARHAVTDGICASISQATIRRWLPGRPQALAASVVDLHLRSELRR